MSPSPESLAILGAVLARQLPQLIVDFLNNKRDKLAVDMGGARVGYVYVCYFAVFVPSMWHLWHGVPHDWLFDVGCLIFACGCAIGAAGFWRLGPVHSGEVVRFDGQELITDGIFAIVRHPIRLGQLLEMLGILLVARALYCLVPWAVLVPIFLVRNTREESLLKEWFGERVEAYRLEVPGMNIVLGSLRFLLGRTRAAKRIRFPRQWGSRSGDTYPNSNG